MTPKTLNVQFSCKKNKCVFSLILHCLVFRVAELGPNKDHTLISVKGMGCVKYAREMMFISAHLSQWLGCMNGVRLAFLTKQVSVCPAG